MDKVRTIKIEVKPLMGANIKDVCSEVKSLADECGVEIEFKFNNSFITTENKSINSMIESYVTQI